MCYTCSRALRVFYSMCSCALCTPALQSTRYEAPCLTYLVPYVLPCPSCFVLYVPYVVSCLTCLVPYMLPCLTCFVPCVPSCLTRLVPYVPRPLRALVLTCFVTYVFACHTCLTYSCTSRIFCLAFPRAAFASSRTFSFAFHTHTTFSRCCEPNILICITCLVAFMSCGSCGFGA